MVKLLSYFAEISYLKQMKIRIFSSKFQVCLSGTIVCIFHIFTHKNERGYFERCVSGKLFREKKPFLFYGTYVLLSVCDRKRRVRRIDRVLYHPHRAIRRDSVAIWKPNIWPKGGSRWIQRWFSQPEGGIFGHFWPFLKIFNPSQLPEFLFYEAQKGMETILIFSNFSNVFEKKGLHPPKAPKWAHLLAGCETTGKKWSKFSKISFFTKISNVSFGCKN